MLASDCTLVCVGCARRLARLRVYPVCKCAFECNSGISLFPKNIRMQSITYMCMDIQYNINGSSRQVKISLSVSLGHVCTVEVFLHSFLSWALDTDTQSVTKACRMTNTCY